jgi:hypothetical protein
MFDTMHILFLKGIVEISTDHRLVHQRKERKLNQFVINRASSPLLSWARRKRRPNIYYF